MNDKALKALIPPSAAWLGALGLVPFVALTGSLPLVPGDVKPQLVHALVAYGATILSFLGGIHWGLAIGSTAPTAAADLKGRLILSVVPSLVAWAALLSPPSVGLVLLAAAIAVMLVVDIRATRVGHAPAWYPRLRIPLSCAVAVSLLAGALL